MADKTSLILTTSSTAQNPKQKSITDINPNATNNELLTFAQNFNSLSTDTLEKVTRVEKRTLESYSYTLIGADEIYLVFTGETSDDWAIYNYLLMDTNNQPVEAEWTLTPIGDAIPTNIAEVGNLYPTARSGFISLEGKSQTGITATYVYEIAAIYNEITYTKQVRIRFFEKGE